MPYSSPAFLLYVRLREFAPDAPEKLELSGRELTQYLTEAKQKVRAALSDDFDTPAAIAELLELVKKCNRSDSVLLLLYDGCLLSLLTLIYRYLATGDVVVPSLVRSIAEFVTEIFKCFGMIPKGADIGFPVSEEEGTGYVYPYFSDADSKGAYHLLKRQW